MTVDTGHLSPLGWVRQSLTKGRRLSLLASHAQGQALDSEHSLSTPVDAHEEEAAVSLQLPLERKEVQPSRWDQAKGGGQDREQGLGREGDQQARLWGGTAAHPSLHPFHQ